MNETPENGGKETTSTADILRKTLRRLTIATVVLYLALGGVALKIYLDGRTTTKALCSLRTDLTNRVLASIQFLKDHPQGIEGIPVKVIIDGISNQSRTIVALKDLSCDEPAVEIKRQPKESP